MKACSKCGSKLKDNDLFCPNCGNKITHDDSYENLIGDIIYVDGRLSKAKTVGVVAAILVFISYIIISIPHSLRYGIITFLITMVICFIHMLLAYGLCRGGGYLIRRFSN